jgi:hypothetical protein
MKPYTLLFLIFNLVLWIDAIAQTTSSGEAKEQRSATSVAASQAIDLQVEAMDKLMGKWAGRVEIPGDFINTMIFRFEKNSDGRLSAYLDCPERGYYGLQITELVFKGDQLSFNARGSYEKYTGTINHNLISGVFVINGKQYALNVVRGKEFEAQIAQVDIPDDAMMQLLGEWNGKAGPMPVIFRFMKNSSGKNVIVGDAPEQSIKDRPVLKASLIDGKLTLKMAGAEYTGELLGNKIAGAMKMIETDVSIPLTLTKK